jgi:menaquinone-dependent protoporphyrinogen oxidase
MNGKVDLCNLHSRNVNPDLSAYDTIIIGGSIRSGKIQDVIAEFCEVNISKLIQKNIGLFINCIYSGEKALKQLDDAYPMSLNEIAIVRDYFGGEIDELNLNYLEKMITKRMIEQDNLIVKLSKDKIIRFAKKMSNL